MSEAAALALQQSDAGVESDDDWLSESDDEDDVKPPPFPPSIPPPSDEEDDVKPPSSPPPTFSNWTRLWDEKTKEYYYQHSDGVTSTWEKPDDYV